jgi:hypothetical protein
VIIQLQPQMEEEKAIRGKTIVYLAGAAPLLFETFKNNGEPVGRFQIPAGGQVVASDSFDKIKVKNMGGVYTESEILVIEGDYARISDVSIVQIQGITNAITANIASLPPVAVNSLPAVTIDSLPAVTIDSLPSVAVSDLPEVVQKDVSNVLTTSYTVAAGGVVTIPAKAGRKRLVLQAYTPSLNTTICRVSDSAKTSIEGQILATGGGLLGELEHKHADALKVWNPSGEDAIEIITQEEF